MVSVIQLIAYNTPLQALPLCEVEDGPDDLQQGLLFAFLLDRRFLKRGSRSKVIEISNYRVIDLEY